MPVTSSNMQSDPSTEPQRGASELSAGEAAASSAAFNSSVPPASLPSESATSTPFFPQLGGHFLGIDLGGTQMRIVIADRDGSVYQRWHGPTEPERGAEATLKRMREQCQRLLDADAASMPNRSRLRAVGIGVPGPTDPYTGTLLMGPNLPGWRNVNFREALGGFGAPVAVGNDANVACLAEHRYGAGLGCTHMIYLTVSTGVGSGAIVNNRLLLGRQGLGAEMGHMTIDLTRELAEADDQPVRGTVEGLASGPNIGRRARAALRSGVKSAVLDYTDGNIDEVDAKVLNLAARSGDLFALDQWRQTGRYLGVGIANLLFVFNPARIVVGGGVWMHAGDLMQEAVWEMIRARTYDEAYWRELELVPAQLGGDVGLLGAVALAVDQLDERRPLPLTISGVKQ